MNTRLALSVMLALALAWTSTARARAPLHLELTLLDAAVQHPDGDGTLTLRQSVEVTTAVYELTHFGLAQLADPRSDDPMAAFIGNLAVSLVDAASVFVSIPPYSIWLHEEGHRASLARRGIRSTNPTIGPPRLPLLAPLPLTGVTDDEVAGLLRDSPADFVRVSTVGFEVQYGLNRALAKNAFFHEQPTRSSFIIPMNNLLVSAYLFQCANESGIAGDCVLAAGALFDPEGPVADGKDIPADQQAWLESQFLLSLLNFIDPFTLDYRGFDLPVSVLGAPVTVSAAPRYVPTSFGYGVGIDGYARAGKLGLMVSPMVFANGVAAFPALGAELVSLPMEHLILSGRVEVWAQPEDQHFDSAIWQPGGSAELRVAGHLFEKRLHPFVELGAKSAGWARGTAFLEGAFIVRGGLSAELF